MVKVKRCRGTSAQWQLITQSVQSWAQELGDGKAEQGLRYGVSSKPPATTPLSSSSLNFSWSTGDLLGGLPERQDCKQLADAVTLEVEL